MLAETVMLFVVIAGIPNEPVEMDGDMAQCRAVSKAIVQLYKATGAEESIHAFCIDRPREA